MEEPQSVLKAHPYFACPNAVFDLPDVYQIAIYAYLSRRAGPDGASWPSLATISRDTKIGLTTVKASLPTMAAAGWIRRERRVNEKGEHTSTLYILGLPSHYTATDGGVGRVATNVGRGAATKVVSSEVGSPFIPTNVSKTEQGSKAVREEVSMGSGLDLGFDVSPGLMDKWRAMFPLVNVEATIRFIFEYAQARPLWTKRRRSWRLTILNWLKREQEKAHAATLRRPGVPRQTMQERQQELMREMEELERRKGAKV